MMIIVAGDNIPKTRTAKDKEKLLRMGEQGYLLARRSASA